MTEPVVIGNATLYLGDCLEILPTLGKVDAVVTDPPYGVNLGCHHGAAESRAGLLTKGGYAGYADTPENFSAVVVPAIRAAIEIADRAAVFGVPPSIWQLPPPQTLGGVFVSAACGRNKWGWSNLVHCLLYGTAPQLHLGAGATAISNNDTAEETGHPVTKPLTWMKWAVNLASTPFDTILDPFMGSGTTGVACAKLGRKFIGIEIEPKYFDIACKRIEQAYAQPDMFIRQAPAAKQEKMF